MSQNKLTKQTFRDILLKIMSRKSLIFLFFLVLSSFFWLMMTLNEITEREVSVPVVLTNIPKNVALTSDSTDTVRITVRDKGYILATYLYGNKIRPISINFQNYAREEGHGSVPNADLQRLVFQQLYNSSRISAIKPEKLDFYFSYGDSKKVPVRFQGKVAAGENYFITDTRIMPDSVTIYALKELLNKIEYVRIEPLNLQNVIDTVRTTVRIERLTGVKAVPAEIQIELYPDVLTEKTIEVPITCINMPEGKALRTFPSKASVHFVVGASLYRSITPEAFSVVVDYKELMEHPDEKCTLHLQAMPNGVSKAQLEFDQVDYLIEQI